MPNRPAALVDFLYPGIGRSYSISVTHKIILELKTREGRLQSAALVGGMEIRAIKGADPIEQTIFEVYTALAFRYCLQ